MDIENDNNTKTAKTTQTEAALTDYDKLKGFTDWMQGGFRKHCEEQFGTDVFATYIHPYYNDMLECVEYHLEDLAEQKEQDEEIAYDEHDNTTTNTD